jgi:hypothetical protein
MQYESQTIDAWVQYPNLGFINHDMFASLRRWMGIDRLTEELPSAIVTNFIK